MQAKATKEIDQQRVFQEIICWKVITQLIFVENLTKELNYWAPTVPEGESASLTELDCTNKFDFPYFVIAWEV